MDDTHDYQTCTDEHCERFPCRVYKEGHADGYDEGEQAGYGAGFAEGWIEGFAAGVASASCSHGG